MGGITGSLLFGISSFIIGRRKIFLVSINTIKITLVIYFFGVMLSGIQTSPLVFILARFLTGVRYIAY